MTWESHEVEQRVMTCKKRMKCKLQSCLATKRWWYNTCSGTDQLEMGNDRTAVSNVSGVFLKHAKDVKLEYCWADKLREIWDMQSDSEDGS